MPLDRHNISSARLRFMRTRALITLLGVLLVSGSIGFFNFQFQRSHTYNLPTGLDLLVHDDQFVRTPQVRFFEIDSRSGMARFYVAIQSVRAQQAVLLTLSPRLECEALGRKTMFGPLEPLYILKSSEEPMSSYVSLLLHGQPTKPSWLQRADIFECVATINVGQQADTARSFWVSRSKNDLAMAEMLPVVNVLRNTGKLLTPASTIDLDLTLLPGISDVQTFGGRKISSIDAIPGIPTFANDDLNPADVLELSADADGTFYWVDNTASARHDLVIIVVGVILGLGASLLSEALIRPAPVSTYRTPTRRDSKTGPLR